MGVWKSVWGKKRAGGEAQIVHPALEPLEPRLLLNADLAGIEPILGPAGPASGHAIYVDLDQDQTDALEGAPSINVDLAGSNEDEGESGFLAGLDLDRFSKALLSGALNSGEETASVEGESQAKSVLPERPVATVEGGVNIEIQAEPCDAASALLQGEAAQPGLAGGQDTMPASESPSIEIRGPPSESFDVITLFNATIYTQEDPPCALAEVGSVSTANDTITPELPGLVLVDPDISRWAGQVVYLDFDGEQDVTYHGPVTIGPFDVPTFQARGESATSEAEVVAGVTASLNDLFAGTGVLFTLNRPSAGTQYSTIYIGGDGSWAAEHGSFLGLAEQVDIGNLDRGDSAHVFTDGLSSSDHPVTYAAILADLIAHEAGHLLGFAHATPSTGGTPLDAVAEIIPERPLLFVPGFGGTFAADESEAGVNEWLLNPGLAPAKLALEPLTQAYDNIVRSFDNIGYTPDSDFFVALWDWRVPVALDVSA